MARPLCYSRFIFVGRQSLLPRLLRARVIAPVALLASVALAAVAGPGCGASYQSMYEGEVRFEHCYRLDLESGVSLQYRRECWREWTQFYTYGQTRDRIEYGYRRLRELSTQLGDPAASSSAIVSPLPPVAHQLAPAPTNPFEPPPATLAPEAVDAGAPSPPASSSAKALPGGIEIDPLNGPPGQTCILLCGKSWKKCSEACGEKKPCHTTCDIKFRGCVPRCF